MTNQKHLNKAKGNYGEDLACQFLLANGFRILARNFACQFGEVDIIATKDAVIHFIEVKNRTKDLIPGRFAVNANKQKHIKKVANYYLTQRNLLFDYLIAFDVIEITEQNLEFLENCFY